MRQAYDYWQDQPGSPRRGTTRRATHATRGGLPTARTNRPTPGIRHQADATRLSRDTRDPSAPTERISPEVQSNRPPTQQQLSRPTKRPSHQRDRPGLSDASSAAKDPRTDAGCLPAHPRPRGVVALATSGTSSDHSTRDHQCSATEAHRFLTPRKTPDERAPTTRRPSHTGDQVNCGGGGATVSRRSGRAVERSARETRATCPTPRAASVLRTTKGAQWETIPSSDRLAQTPSAQHRGRARRLWRTNAPTTARGRRVMPLAPRPTASCARTGCTVDSN